MNIFLVEETIEKCAQSHFDKHVVKMRVKLAQIACSVHHNAGTPAQSIPYRLTHSNHPSSVWARESLSNYRYTVALGLELCEEMRHRFGTKYQKAEDVLQWCYDNEPQIEDRLITLPVAVVPDELKVNEPKTLLDVVENYRNLYKNGKQHLHKWTNRTKPNWI